MSCNTLGERIKHHRKRLCLTQEQLADKLGVSAQAVSKWENNQSCPDISILPEISDLFSVSIDELLGKGRQPDEAVQQAETDEKSEGFSPSFKRDIRAGIVLFALYIIFAGALMIINHTVGLDVSWWTVIWTLAVFFIGVGGLIEKFSVFGLTLTLAGAYFLVSAYGLLSLSLSRSIVIPVILVLWGISILVDVLCYKKIRKNRQLKHDARSKKAHHECSCTDGNLRCEMNFGGYRTAVRTPILRGGSIEANFGDFTVDFSGCEAVAPDCNVKVENSFGSLALLIPKRFRLTLNQESGVACTVDQSGAPNEETEGTIHIELETDFGSVSIRYID